MLSTEEKPGYLLIVGRVFFTLGLVASIAFVFSNSMAVAETSSEASTSVLNWVQICLIKLGMPDLSVHISEHLIRKTAHVCEYMLVGFFLMLCLRVYTKRFIRHISWPMFGGLLVAVVDETIQLFSAGRSSSVTDVWIDFCGIMLGLLVALFLLCLWRMAWILYQNRE